MITIFLVNHKEFAFQSTIRDYVFIVDSNNEEEWISLVVLDCLPWSCSINQLIESFKNFSSNLSRFSHERFILKHQNLLFVLPYFLYSFIRYLYMIPHPFSTFLWSYIFEHEKIHSFYDDYQKTSKLPFLFHS